MTITEITEVSKARCRVMIDQEIAFVLYKGDLRIYHLKQGEEIAPEVYEELMTKVLPKRAKLRCLNLLKSRDYAESDLIRKLKTGGYPESVIEEALSYVKSYGYVSNESYAKKYIETYAETKSRRKIEQELIQKGIPKSIITGFYEEAAGNAEDPEAEQIRRLLKKKNYSPGEMTREQQMKIFAFLARKGYSAEKIRKYMGNFDGYDGSIEEWN